jgi:hypothetical protein
MTQFDPSMVAQMLMQPIQRATENLGGGPFGIGADAGGSYFVDPEVAARTGYGTAVTGTSFFPGAGIVDAAGGAVDITGQPLPSFSENIREGQFTDAGLQALGVAGDIATIAAPLTGGATALLGAMMKAPRAAQKVTKATDVASDVAGIAKVEPPTETQPGIIAFHGSGADFDEFKLEKIGTGEGNQAFGYGLYFSDSEDIGNFYKKTTSKNYTDLTQKFMDQKIGDKSFGEYDIEIRDEIVEFVKNNDKQGLIKFSKERKQRWDELSTDSSYEFNDYAKNKANAYNEFINDLETDKKLVSTQGKTYKVALEPKIDELLDYDLSLKEQPEKFKKILKPIYEKYSVSEAADFGTLLESVKSMRTIPDDAFMEELSNKGIKGIKYKAGQLSGITDSDATNFVIFDDKLIKILEKYGIVGPVAVSATAAALRDDDGST